MQIPKRKPGKYSQLKKDFHMTQAKYDQQKARLEGLKEVHPVAVKEVMTLAELGDFSENAAYQMAKGRLRGINQKILELESELKHAVIIEPNINTNIVQLGSTVTVVIDRISHRYKILGSAETNPSRGIISQHSPIGAALIGHRVGDEVTFAQGVNTASCQIVEIS